MSNDESDAWRKQARAQTDPLFFHDHFLSTGHDVNTKNATATFVQFENRIFACTCRHVIEILHKRQETKHSRFPTLALVIDRTVLNLSFFTAEGLKLGIVVPKPSEGVEPVDLAIAEITGSYWELLTKRKGKLAIDLDNWREPRWARAEMLVAAGYPDEHKDLVAVGDEEKVGTPLVLVVAECDGEIARDKRLVSMRSRLAQPHEYYFSGMSGGPIYVQQDELLVPAGILFEGWPQSKGTPRHAVLDMQDIVVRGLTLTPSNFGKWLKAPKLKEA